MEYYYAFQLNIASELAFPELQAGYPLAEVDCSIRIGHVSSTGLETPTHKTPFYQVARNQFWLSIPDIGRFEVKNGRTITIEPDALVDKASLRLFILGPCLNALLLQQGYYILNGDVFSVNQQHACAIIGHSGVGKSVLTQALLNQDLSLLSSGLCVINSTGQVQSGYPRIQLWTDAIRLLSLEKPEQRIRPLLEKWYVTADHHFCNKAQPLRSIYLLHTHNKPDVSFTPVKGFAKFNQLRSYTAHQSLIEHLVDFRQYQLRGTSLANQIHITKIARPDHGNTVKALVEHISLDLKGLSHEHA